MMSSRALIVGAVATGCLSAAGIGGYLAVRTATQASEAASASVVTSGLGEAMGGFQSLDAAPQGPADQVIDRPSPAPVSKPGKARVATPAGSRTIPVTSTREGLPPAREPGAPAALPITASSIPAPDLAPESSRAVPLDAPPIIESPRARFEDIMVDADTVIGIRLETPLSSESSRVEDRVTARVTRDVRVDSRTVIPAGARMEGLVTTVERGGKIRDRARIGVRFSSLVSADDVRVPIQTETIYRDGDAPGGEATAKIGASAVIGSILGGVIGGRKGAVIGGATGAAGGTAVVMTGGRNEAVIAAGTLLTVRLTEAVDLQIEAADVAR